MSMWDITLHGSADCVWDRNSSFENNFNIAELDNDHFMLMWDCTLGDDDLLLRIYEIDGSGIPSAAGDLYTLIDATQTLVSWPFVLKWQDNCCIVFYTESPDYETQAQVLTYNSDTWNITNAGSQLTIGGSASSNMSQGIFKLGDSGNHVLFAWRGLNGRIWLRAGSVNVAGSSISLVGSADLEVRYADYGKNSVSVVDLDSEGHYALTYQVGNSPYIRTFEIDGSGQLAWAGSELDAGSIYDPTFGEAGIYKIDQNHVVFFFNTGTTAVYSFSDVTWAFTYVAQLANPFGDSDFKLGTKGQQLKDSVNKFIVVAHDSGSPYKMRLRCVEVNLGDYSVAVLGSAHYESEIGFVTPHILVRDAADSYEYVVCFVSDRISPYDNYLRTFKIAGPDTGRSYLNLFAHAAGTQYKFLESEAKAGLISLHDALVEMGPAGYGSFSCFLTEVKGAGVLWEFLNTEISDVSNWYTAFSRVFFEAKGANALFKFFRGDARAAVAVFKTLSCVAGARYIIDTDIPYIRYDHYPVDGQVAVNPYHPIIMRIVDDGLGLDLSSYWCKVNGVKYSYGDAEVKAYPINPPNEYLFAVKPTFMGWNKSVTIDVYCNDLYGNPGLLREVL